MGIPKRKTNAVSSSGHTDRQKAAPTAVFAFLESISDKTVPRMYVNYKPARLVKTKTRWYVEYYYRQANHKWKRIRIFENINRIKTDEYAKLLVDATNEALANGMTPLKDPPTKESKEWSLNIALDKFLEHSKENGLRGKTLQTYGTVVNFVKDHFIKDNSLYKPVTWIGKEHIKDFMQAARARQGWNNNTYNNYLRYLKTFFLTG